VTTVPYHPPVKRSVQIDRHKTSISLEPMFWDMLKAAAAAQGIPVNALVARIDAERIQSATPPGLAGAIRVWLVAQMQTQGPLANAAARQNLESPAQPQTEIQDQ